MIEPKDLSTKQLKEFKEHQIFTKNNTNDLKLKEECFIVISMIEEELENRIK